MFPRLWWLIVVLCVCVTVSQAQTQPTQNEAILQLAEKLAAAPNEETVNALLDEKKEMVNADLMRALKSLGDMSMRRSQLLEARKRYDMSRRIAERIGDEKGIANALTGMGDTNRQSDGDYRQTLEYYQQALAIYERLKDNLLIAITLNNLGTFNKDLGYYPQALEMYQRGLAIFETLDRKDAMATVLMNMGVVKEKQGDYIEAINNYQKALPIFEALGNRGRIADVITNQGIAEKQLGRFLEALESYQKALAIFEALDDKVGIFDVYMNMGVVYKNQGRYPLAREFYKKALDLTEAMGSKHGKALCWANLGNVENDLGNYALAFQDYQKAVAIFEDLGDRQSAAIGYGNIGNLYSNQGDYARAIDSYQKAIPIYEALGDKQGIAYSYQNLALIYERQRNYSKAMESYQKALPLFELIKDQLGAAVTLTGMGGAYIDQGQLEPAMEYLQRALAMHEKLGSQRYSGNTYWAISAVLYQQKRFPAALEQAQRALSLAQEMKDLTGQYQALGALGAIYQQLNDQKKAEDMFRQAINIAEILRRQTAGGETERQQAFQRNLDAYLGLVNLLIEQKRLPEAFELAERTKARTLSDVLQNGRNDIAKDLTPQEREREQQLNAQVKALNVELYRESTKPTPDESHSKELNTRLSKAQGEYDSYQTQLYAAHPNLARQRGGSTPLTLIEVASLLPDARTAVLEYVMQEDKTFLFVLTKGATTPNVQVFTLPLTRQLLTEKAKAWQAQMERNSDSNSTVVEGDYGFPLRQLYDLLLRPARAALTGKTNLVIVPDGPLWELPFQAFMPSGNRALLEDATIAYAPSLTFLRDRVKLRAAKPATKELLAMGIGDFSSSQRGTVMNATLPMPNIPEARSAILGIIRYHAATQSTAFMDRDATEERFKENAPTHRILQFFSHGYLNNARPLYSRIVLAPPDKDAKEDGFLEAREIMQMNLRAELAILGACETGRGGISNGEGVIGLSWAFLVAGVPNTVVSQWRVRSNATKELMIEFHRQMTKKPQQSKAESLRQASLKLMRSEQFRAPYYWASFVLVGDGK